jgi:transcription initiation factor TFIID subunit TAF12
MRVAVIVVSMLVVTTPSQASKSCMSKTEARQNFGSVHIYWHGNDHCWDATGTRRLVHQVRPKRQIREVQRNEVQRNIDQPRWQESMSQMLADAEPAQTNPQTPWVNRWVEIEPSRPVVDAPRVDIARVVPSSIERKPAPMVSLHIMLLVLITVVIALTLATIEFTFRRAVY